MFTGYVQGVNTKNPEHVAGVLNVILAQHQPRRDIITTMLIISSAELKFMFINFLKVFPLFVKPNNE